MGDKIDIYKITLDFLKGNKVFFYIVVAIIGGGTAGYNLPDFTKPIVKPIEKPAIIKKDCGDCSKEMMTLEKKLKEAKEEISKLKRWH